MNFRVRILVKKTEEKKKKEEEEEKKERMACTQQPHYPETDEHCQQQEEGLEREEVEELVPLTVHQPEFVVAETSATRTIQTIEVKAPKCFREASGGLHWKQLWASYDKVRSVYSAMVYCSLPYTARMIMYSYMGFSKLFSSFCLDKNDERAIDMFTSIYCEFDEVHRILLKSDITAISSVLNSINKSQEKIFFSLPMQEKFALQIRQIFTPCVVNDRLNIRIDGSDNPLFIGLHDIPLFQDEHYSFDILWKYSQKTSPINTYACVVLEKLVRVLKDGLYKIAQCMVLFFVYTLKLVCKLIEHAHAPIEDAHIRQFHKNLYSRLNAKLIKVFSNFVNIVGVAGQHTNYEKNLREEQRKGALEDSGLQDSAIADAASHKHNCLLS